MKFSMHNVTYVSAMTIIEKCINYLLDFEFFRDNNRNITFQPTLTVSQKLHCNVESFNEIKKLIIVIDQSNQPDYESSNSSFSYFTTLLGKLYLETINLNSVLKMSS